MRGVLESKRCSAERKIFDRHATNEMFLNDAFQVFPGALSVPNPFRVDEGDRAIEADAQTFGFGAKNPALDVDESQFRKPRLQEGPGLCLTVAFGAGPADAEKDVPLDALELESFRHAGELFVEIHRAKSIMGGRSKK